MPALPEPDEITMAPALPFVAAPDDIVIDPELPSLVVPVANRREPLTPFSPEFALAITTDPLDRDEP